MAEQLPPSRFDIVLVEGADWIVPWQLLDSNNNPINITSCTISGSVASAYLQQQPFPQPSPFICNISGSITVPISGQFSTIVPATVTATIPQMVGTRNIAANIPVGKYDLFIIWSNGQVQKLWYGDVRLNRSVNQIGS